MFKFTDNFFDRIEKKTNVGKDTILKLADKLQQGNLKDEGTLREVIQELGKMTGKDINKDKEDKIINAVVNDKIPKDIDKML
ncbi:MAG: stage VI sporulation protein F [Candidatus Faecisoma sp.]|jgi:hypothetical protein|nr:stage VI sporulation protein F [Acholeplasma sp.]MCI5677978.1 stage VI sporulation protein F [Acholeplasma sp.]MDY2892982.1 stage VI sporulation protein F [Candidatus Faecisoma sp.]CCY28821.1 putative uncharacterized protein [Acholeplasma sp. CAG:878]